MICLQGKKRLISLCGILGKKRSTDDCEIKVFGFPESYPKREVDLLIYYQFKLDKLGDSGRTRTPNLLIRSQLLYPVEQSWVL